MKSLFISFIAFLSYASYAQSSQCEYDLEEKTDSTSVRKTPEYLIYEKDFVNTSEYLNFSLINVDGTPYLKIQLLQKSNGFISAKSTDENSKVYLQLTNGKICTLISSENAQSQLIYDEKSKTNTRVLNGYFMFTKENYDYLKSEKVSMIRIKYSTETTDYVMKKELNSQRLKSITNPENYFINFLKCVE